LWALGSAFSGAVDSSSIWIWDFDADGLAVDITRGALFNAFLRWGLGVGWYWSRGSVGAGSGSSSRWGSGDGSACRAGLWDSVDGGGQDGGSDGGGELHFEYKIENCVERVTKK